MCVLMYEMQTRSCKFMKINLKCSCDALTCENTSDTLQVQIHNSVNFLR